jgi:purine-binding chemotaxis protein CheW
MNHLEPFLVFTIDDHRYALRLCIVERVIHAIAVTPLPGAPDIVAGVINVHSRIVPVFNIRQRFHFPARKISLTDRFIIARTMRRTVVLITDAVYGVIEYPGRDVIPAKKILDEIKYVDGAIGIPDGMVLIHDLDQFLSPAEEEDLNMALGNP